jgi:hypothetical protein
MDEATKTLLAAARIAGLSEEFEILLADAERWRKIREYLYFLCILPHKFERFLRITGGSTRKGLDEAMDKEEDPRAWFEPKPHTEKVRGGTSATNV